MIVIRTDAGLMVCKASNILERVFLKVIETGALPTRPLELPPGNEFKSAFQVADDYTLIEGDLKLFLWKGSKIYCT